MEPALLLPAVLLPHTVQPVVLLLLLCCPVAFLPWSLDLLTCRAAHSGGARLGAGSGCKCPLLLGLRHPPTRPLGGAQSHGAPFCWWLCCLCCLLAVVCAYVVACSCVNVPVLALLLSVCCLGFLHVPVLAELLHSPSVVPWRKMSGRMVLPSASILLPHPSLLPARLLLPIPACLACLRVRCLRVRHMLDTR